jgi:hypothetical protein
MPLVRKFAVQGHAVPEGYRTARGPFPTEILAQPKMEYEAHHSDSLHESLDDVRLFRCKDCGEVMYEDELSEHGCVE